MRPSCGRRFSAMSSFDITLMRDTTSGATARLVCSTSRSTPSTRKRTTSRFSNGSTWMSEAFSRTAWPSTALISRMIGASSSLSSRSACSGRSCASCARSVSPSRPPTICRRGAATFVGHGAAAGRTPRRRRAPARSGRRSMRRASATALALASRRSAQCAVHLSRTSRSTSAMALGEGEGQRCADSLRPGFSAERHCRRCTGVSPGGASPAGDGVGRRRQRQRRGRRQLRRIVEAAAAAGSARPSSSCTRCTSRMLLYFALVSICVCTASARIFGLDEDHQVGLCRACRCGSGRASPISGMRLRKGTRVSPVTLLSRIRPPMTMVLPSCDQHRWSSPSACW